MFIEADNIRDAHLTLIRMILNNGNRIITEDAEYTVESYTPLMVVIDNPLQYPRYVEDIGYSDKFLKDYSLQMIYAINKDQGFSYTYGERFRYYPYDRDEEGNIECYDQLDSIIYKLSLSPQTRRAIMHTWSVREDAVSSNPPCLQTVQVMIRNMKLNMVATFRSNDMLSAWGANVYGLSEMQQHIRYELEHIYDQKYGIGTLTTVSTNPHIYYIRDRNVIETLYKIIPINMERLYGKS